MCVVYVCVSVCVSVGGGIRLDVKRPRFCKKCKAFIYGPYFILLPNIKYSYTKCLIFYFILHVPVNFVSLMTSTKQ